jgi:hypothetical protein
MKLHEISHGTHALFTTLAIALMLIGLTCGCIRQQPAAPSPQAAITSRVTAIQPDNGHILVTYLGGQAEYTLMELEITVIDSGGKSKTQSIGSRLATTPVQVQATNSFTGSFAGKDRVSVTAYYSDGSQKTVLDTFV